MANFTEQLTITKVLETGEIEAIQRERLTREHFMDPEMRETFSVVLSHVEKYGALPSVSLLQEMTPFFEPLDSDDTLQMAADRLREKYLSNDIATALRKAQVSLGRDSSMAALTTLQSDVERLIQRHIPVEDKSLSESIKGVKEAYFRRKGISQSGTELLGLPWLWPSVNEATGGIRESDFIMFYGQAKSYKTWVLIATLVHIYRMTGARIVLATKEMTKEQVMDRLACMYAGLPWAAFNRGTLDDDQEQRFLEAMEELEAKPPFLIVELAHTGMDALTELQNRAKQYQAQLVAIDGFYFLSQKQGDWKELTELTRATRQMSLRIKVPFLIVHQANAEGNAAYSRSFQQDVTYMARITSENEHKQHREAFVDWPFVRDHRPEPLLIHTRPGESFGEKRVEAAAEGDGSLLGEDEPDNALVVEAGSDGDGA